MNVVFTDRLLQSNDDAFKTATTNKFLECAGNGSLSHAQLLSWLKHDRVYTLIYAKFIAGLIRKVPLALLVEGMPDSVHRRVLECLTFALKNVMRETQLFENILQNASEEDHDVQGAEEPSSTGVTQYANLFEHAVEADKDLLYGMVVLWSTEICYYEAWLLAKKHKSYAPVRERFGIVHQTLIPNWTSSEFKEFVDTVASLVNELRTLNTPGPQDLESYETVCRKVMEIEQNFWPDVTSSNGTLI